MVFVYGTVCRDRLHRVERLPEPGGYVEIIENVDTLGGEAFNTALALRLWGEEVVLGGNSLGDRARDSELEAFGLTPMWLPTGQHFEPVCDIYVTPDGQRTMFGRGFREMPEWGDPSLMLLESGNWFTADANHGEKAHEAVRAAKISGMFTYAEDFVEPNAPRTDFWQSSTDWVARKGDIQYNVRWLTAWIEERNGFGVLSDGANGFVAGGNVPGGRCVPVRHFPPFPCPKLVDSTGAGDVFRAGMLLGLSRDWKLPECLRFASAAGSLNCKGLGANSAIPTMAEAQTLIASHPEIAKSYE